MKAASSMYYRHPTMRHLSWMTPHSLENVPGLSEAAHGMDVSMGSLGHRNRLFYRVENAAVIWYILFFSS